MGKEGQTFMMDGEEVTIKENAAFKKFRSVYDLGYYEWALHQILDILEEDPSQSHFSSYLDVMMRLNRLHEVFVWFRGEKYAKRFEDWVERFDIQDLLDASYGGTALIRMHQEMIEKTPKGIPPKANSRIWFLLTTMGTSKLSLLMALVSFFREDYGVVLPWIGMFEGESRGLFQPFCEMVKAEAWHELAKEGGAQQKHYENLSAEALGKSLQGSNRSPFAVLSAVRMGLEPLGSYYQAVSVSRSRFYLDQADIPVKEAEIQWNAMAVRGLFSDPYGLDVYIGRKLPDAIREAMAWRDNWVEAFEDWHRGDYNSVMELVETIRIGEILGKSPTDAERMAFLVLYWRVLFVRGQYDDLLRSMFTADDLMKRKVYLEAEMMRNLAVLHTGGIEAARGAFIDVIEKDWEEYASHFGSFSFDAYLFMEVADFANNRKMLARIMQRIKSSEWYQPYIEGRVREETGDWDLAREKYKEMEQALDAYHPGHFMRGEIYWRLAQMQLSCRDHQAGAQTIEKLKAYCERWMPKNETLKAKLAQSEAKLLVLTGQYQKAVVKYRRLLATNRLQGKVDRPSYLALSQDWIAMMTAIGQLREAKEEIDRFPDELEIHQLQKMRMTLLWAVEAGEVEMVQTCGERLLAAIRDRDEGKEGGFSILEKQRILTVILDTHLKANLPCSQLCLEEAERYLAGGGTSVSSVEGWLVWARWQNRLEAEIAADRWEAVERTIECLGNPPLLVARFWQVRAAFQNGVRDRVVQSVAVLREYLGESAMETLQADADLLREETDPEMVAEQIMRLYRGSVSAITQRLGIVPTERQLTAVRHLQGIYAIAMEKALAVDNAAVVEIMVDWTYALKGIHLRIHRHSVMAIHEESREADFEKFALLSQQIVECVESDLQMRGQWISQRDALAEDLGIYQERIYRRVMEKTQPELPAGRTYLEMVETEQGVYCVRKTDMGWRLRKLGTKREWEKRLIAFRRKLLRSQAEYQRLAVEVFQETDCSRPVCIAPDGLLFSLPWMELAEVSGIEECTVWPNLMFLSEKMRRFHAHKGMGLFGWTYEEKEDLPCVLEEAEAHWSQGYHAFRANKKHPDFSRVYPGYFHFSGHGEYLRPDYAGVLRNPFVESRLVLPSGDVVTALDLAIMDWRETSMVYLNACESGAGDLAPLQGVLGLSYGLFMGGTNAAIVTLYPVSDETAAQVGILFYRILNKVKDPWVALSSVKTALKEQVSQRELAAIQLWGSRSPMKESWRSRGVRWYRRRKRKKVK